MFMLDLVMTATFPEHILHARPFATSLQSSQEPSETGVLVSFDRAK